jgi:flagellar basal-body rod protein FlgB
MKPERMGHPAIVGLGRPGVVGWVTRCCRVVGRLLCGGRLDWFAECFSRGGGEAMQIGTAMGEALGRYLDLTANEMKLTAGNIANIDTPGFKTQGFDFEKEFANALDQSMSLDEAMTPEVSEVDGLVARPDGNTVSMDRESMQLAKSQLQFRAGVALLRGEFSVMMAAIHVDSK